LQLATRLEKVSPLLAERAAEYKVPGAALAVSKGDEVFETATGLVNVATGVEATPDSVFQIGSITKTFTSTLVMQLVEEGRIDLDTPVWSYMPEVHFGDPDATVQITVRQLLTHTSGLDGDFFEDAGRGADCVERYVLACRALPQLHAPGKMFSYCNAGFVVLGRLIEKFRGATWDDVLRANILERIGTEKMGTHPEDAILHRAAVGHMPHPETREPVMVPVWRLQAASGPAGATPFATARDLLRFADAIQNGGTTEKGKPIVSGSSIEAMLEKQVDVPAGHFADGWGLGWMLFDWGRRVFGHDGGTIGQFSFLRVVPDRGLAMALLTNGGDAQALYRDVFNEVLGELAEISIPPPPEPTPDLDLDLSRYAGRYERIATRYDVEVKDGALEATSTGLRGAFRALPPQKFRLEPVNRELFVGPTPMSSLPVPATFLEFDDEGRPGYVHAGGRATPRRPSV
jgi:CubicO group peptidase (beta-lactamase class C family)